MSIRAKPLSSPVVSMRAGQANNVMPDHAVLEIGVRAVDRGPRTTGKRVYANFDWRHGYPVLVNGEAETQLAFDTACRLLGADRVTRQGPPITASEDFGFMLERIPGSYFLIGNGAEGTPGACMVHHPNYDFNDANSAIGSALWAAIVSGFLGEASQSE